MRRSMALRACRDLADPAGLAIRALRRCRAARARFRVLRAPVERRAERKVAAGLPAGADSRAPAVDLEEAAVPAGAGADLGDAADRADGHLRRGWARCGERSDWRGSGPTGCDSVFTTRIQIPRWTRGPTP